MEQYIKTYPNSRDCSWIEDLSFPRVAFLEEEKVALFSSGLQHVEEQIKDLHEGYYKSLLEELAERVVALEEGKSGNRVFLTTTEYEKLTNPNGNHTAIDEDGNVITYDPKATYYTYDEESSDVTILEPVIDEDGFLDLRDYGVIDNNDDFLDFGDYARIDEDGYLYFVEAMSSDNSYIEDGIIFSDMPTIDEDGYLTFDGGVIDYDGYLTIE